MSSSLVITALIVVIISSLAFVFNILIYKKTTGGSKAYYFWALASTFTFLGAVIGLVSSFFMDPNKVELEGSRGFIAIVQLTLYLEGYFYIALGSVYLPGDLKITNVNLDKLLNLRKIAFLGILIWSLFVTLLLIIANDKFPVRMFYSPFYTAAWLFSFFALLPIYKAVKDYAGYWIYLLLATLFGFLANLGEVLAYFFVEEIIVLEPLFYIPMGIFLVLGYYKLGKDLQAF